MLKDITDITLKKRAYLFSGMLTLAVGAIQDVIFRIARSWFGIYLGTSTKEKTKILETCCMDLLSCS